MNHFKRAKHLLTLIKTYSKTVYNIHGAYMNEVVVLKRFWLYWKKTGIANMYSLIIIYTT